MRQAVNKYFITIVEILITVLLATVLIICVSIYKDNYKKTYEKQQNISYVEKNPDRTEYSFENH